MILSIVALRVARNRELDRARGWRTIQVFAMIMNQLEEGGNAGIL